jgi:DNA-binding LytR/AlgR family response regulator
MNNQSECSGWRNQSKMNYNCIIVDDERPALKLLKAYLEKMPQLELMASCENAMEAISALNEHATDLLFLDIQMPNLTGIDLLKIIKIQPKVVLTTAYRNFAVEGFALNVTDYLVKPFSFERFVQAVNKATNQIDLERKETVIKTVAIEETNSNNHFFVRTNYKIEKVEFEHIQYVESMREYVAIHTKNQRLVINHTMHKMEEALPSKRFFRVHRSFIVSLEHIQGVEGNMILIGDKKIPIGGSYRKLFFEQLNLL